jgi:acyl-CoA dehydrogenase
VDFSISEEHLELKKWAHEFAEREIRPVAAEYDESEEFPWPVVKKAAESGLYSLDIYMQAQQDPTGLTLPLLMEEVFWGCAGIGLCIFGTGLPLSALASVGTQEQLFEWAPRMFGTPEDPKVAAFCVTEPQAGSDVRSLRTRARREGHEWVLNGQKIYITNGSVADVFVVVATVDPELGHRGQASFVIAKDDGGIRAGKKEKKLGIRASDTSEVLLEDCRIPLDRVLGGVDRLESKLDKARKGESTGRSSAALRTFEVTRPSVASQAVGIARAALEFAIDYSKDRVAFGVPIGQHQSIQNHLADMAVEIEAARLLTHKAARLKDAGERSDLEAGMAKLFASETGKEVVEEAFRIHGGYGYSKEYEIERLYRDAPLLLIGEGTSEIQRMVIGKKLLERHKV